MEYKCPIDAQKAGHCDEPHAASFRALALMMPGLIFVAFKSLESDIYNSLRAVYEDHQLLSTIPQGA